MDVFYHSRYWINCSGNFRVSMSLIYIHNYMYNKFMPYASKEYDQLNICSVKYSDERTNDANILALTMAGFLYEYSIQ